MRIRLGGYVTDNDSAAIYRRWGYNDVCCPKDVRNAVENCPDGEELVFEINSPGGSVYQGFEMYSVIRGHKGETVAEVMGVAASAMSVAMAGCKKVLMSPVGQVMIHRASVAAHGNSQVMKETKQWLDTLDKSILNAYTEKSGGKTGRDAFARMMCSETFMTAQEAIDCGLADGMIESAAGVDLTKAVASMGPWAGVMDLPPVEDLLRREREAESRDGADDEESPSQPAVAENMYNSERRKQHMDENEIKTVEGLRAAFPELTAQIASEAAEAAAKAERERIAGIDALAMPGFEDIIRKAKEDPEQNAGTVAQEMILAQKKSGSAYLSQVQMDAQNSRVNEVPAASSEAGAGKGDGEETLEQAAKAAVATWQKEGAMN